MELSEQILNDLMTIMWFRGTLPEEGKALAIIDKHIAQIAATNADLLDALKCLRKAEKDCAGMRCFHSNFDDHPLAFELYDAEEAADQAIQYAEEQP